MSFRDSLSGDVVTWQEQVLQLVDIDELGETAYSELIDELSDLVVWSDTIVRPFDVGRLRHRLILSSQRCLSPRAGYSHPDEEHQKAGKAYLGDPWRMALRYRLQAGRHWQAGITFEKDPGEAWRNELSGTDTWHGFVRLRNADISRNLKVSDAVVGHYRLHMGCGLMVNQGFSLGKQYLTQQLTTSRQNTISPHASLTESGYMQGAAADLRIGRHLTLLPYVSARQVDGTLTDDFVLTALQSDGYHRTYNEQRHRQAAWQWVSGMRMGWRGEWYDVGLHGMFTQLQYDYIRQYNYYNTRLFRGHQLAQFSADYSARFWDMTLRGECAVDDRGAMAIINALQYKVGSYWQGSLLHRYFSNHYRQLHASTVSESSGIQGEQGLLLQADGQIARFWQLHAMADLFAFSQPQYGIREETSCGVEGVLRLQYSRDHARRIIQASTIGYRIKQKGDFIRHAFDATLSLHPLSQLVCRTQAHARIYSKKEQEPTFGYSLSQSLAWQCSRWRHTPFYIEGQANYFCTDDYDSRVYLSERAVLYGFGLPMLYGQGLRYSITGSCALWSRFHLDAKWALTNYANRHSISSGLQQIAGNTQQDLWLQLRISL